MTVVNGPPRTVPPSHAPARRASRVVSAVARAEARRLVRHPLLWAGVLIGGMLLAVVLGALAFVLPRESVLVQVAALPVAATTLAAAHLAATRPRHDDTEALLAAAPATRGQRTAGLLLAVTGPAVLAALLVGATLGGMAAAGAVGPVDVVEAATAPVLVALAGVLGVALGRLAPWRAAPWLAVALLAVVQFGLSASLGQRPPLAAVLAPAFLPNRMPFDPGAVVRPAGAHLLYLTGFVVVVAGGALATARPRRAGAAVAAVGAAAAVAGGWLQYRPPAPETVQRIVARVTDPASTGTCVEREPATRICAVEPYTGWLDRWTDPVSGVRSRLVASGVSVETLEVIQQPERFAAEYSLARWLGRPNPASTSTSSHRELFYDDDPGAIALATDWPRNDDRAQLILALETARRAVGMPATVETEVQAMPGSAPVDGVAELPAVQVTRCNAVGQAREVVAVWLAAQATETTAATLRQVVAQLPYGLEGDQQRPWLVGRGSQRNLLAPGVAGVTADWSRVATNHAVALLDRPAAEVMATLAADWSRWTDPATPVRELVADLDLDPLPTAEQLWQPTGTDEDVPDEVELSYRDTPLPPPDQLARNTDPSSELPIPPPSPYLACP